jgi:hypothetical protein
MVPAKLFCSTSLVCASSAENGSSSSTIRGIDRQRAGQGGALPLAAGELIGIAIGQFGQAAAPEFAHRALAPLCGASSAALPARIRHCGRCCARAAADPSAA